MRLFREHSRNNLDYTTWVDQFDTLAAEDIAAIRLAIATQPAPPLFSIILCLRNANANHVKSILYSLAGQLYERWELLVVDCGDIQSCPQSLLASCFGNQWHDKVRYQGQSDKIFSGVNQACAAAAGEFCIVLEPGGQLPPHALYLVAVAINEKPDVDLLYSDEDRIDRKGRRFSPNFKPDWDPETLLSQNYISHLSVYRTKLIREAGGVRAEAEGMLSWDLALRVTDLIEADRIHHLPYVLYHKFQVSSPKKLPQSTSESSALHKKIVADHLARKGISADIAVKTDGGIRVYYHLPSVLPKVSIIIPTRNGLHLIKRCIESLRSETDYDNYELIIVDNQSDDLATLQYLDGLSLISNVRIVQYSAPFNFAAITNFAARVSEGEILCLLNNDTEIISPSWLKEMVSHAIRSEVGAVGAMLYFPDNTIQHAGVIIGLGGIAGHWHMAMKKGARGYEDRATFPQGLSAVTAACMVLRRNVFDEVGGMDEVHLPVAYNDVDLCLKIREKGYRVVWTPYAELYHHESASRGKDDTPEKRARFERETAYLRERWGDWIAHDPAYNPNLSLRHAWPQVVSSIRLVKPWQRFDA